MIADSLPALIGLVQMGVLESSRTLSRMRLCGFSPIGLRLDSPNWVGTRSF